MNSKTKYSKLYEPMQIGRMKLKNHIMVPPMLCCLASADGRVTDKLLRYTSHLAKNGAGLVIFGETNVDNERSYDHVYALNVGDDIAIPGLAQIAEEVHRHGAKISIELSHAGACAEPILLKPGQKGISPSPVPPWMHPGYSGCSVEIMDRAMMDHVKQNYLDAVGRLVKAGFDMVTFHCAHGWLMGQFLSPYFNTRTDEYGGSLENRMRFPLEVLKAIHDEYHDQICIDMRVSGRSGVPEEIRPQEEDFQDVLAYIKAAEPYLDMVNISAGFIPFLPSLNYMIQSYMVPHLTNVEFAERIKKEVNIPVAIAGSITTLDEAEGILEEGRADLVGMARAGLADTDCFTKGEQGREDEIRPCLRCCRCSARIEPPAYKGIQCAVNPTVGRELEYPCIPSPLKKKKVLIIGGGPAGMEACQRACELGHEVVLYEKEAQLGGMLHTASALPFKGDMRRYLAWMIETTMKSGATIHLNTEATPEIIKAENADVVLIGTGSEPIQIKIPVAEGKEFVWAGDVDTGRASVGDTVVVAGAGLTGTETAIALAQEGKKVTVIDRIPEPLFLKGNPGPATLSIMALLQGLDVTFLFESSLKEITADGVVYTDKEGVEHTIPCDSAINALGMTFDKNAVDELLNASTVAYAIGDCSGKEMTIAAAVLDGFARAMDV